MTTATRPHRTVAVAALQKAIKKFSGYRGPGRWTVDQKGRDFITLTYTSGRLAVYPEYVFGSEPWDLWGGQEILASSNLKSDRTVSGEDSTSFFGSAIIFVED